MRRLSAGMMVSLLALSLEALAAPSFTDRGFGGSFLNPGDQRLVVQAIEVRGDSRDGGIDAVQIRNVGTATPTQVTEIVLGWGTARPTKPTDPLPGTPVVRTLTAADDLQVGIVISLSPAFALPRNATRYLWVAITVAAPANVEGGETVRFETNLAWYTTAESGWSGWKADGKPEEIRKAGFEEITDDSADPGTLNPGDLAPVHKVKLRDTDANEQGIKITGVRVRNAGGATAQAGDLQTVSLKIIHGTTTYNASKAPTGWDGTGVPFARTDFAPTFPTSFPDGVELTVLVEVTIKTPPTATAPRDEVTIQSEVVLTVEEYTGTTIDQEVTAPTTWLVRRAGFEEVEELSVPPLGLGLNPGDRLTQVVWVADRDYNSKHVQVTRLWVRNQGTADTADVAGFVVSVGTTQVRSGWPTGFDFRAGGWIPLTPSQVNDEREQTITIEYRISPLATTGRTLQPEVRVGTEEPPVGSPSTPPTYATPAVTYPEAVTIFPAGFEVVQNIAIDPRTVFSTERFVAQKLKLEDKDGNTSGLTITRVRVKNVGTAADAQFVKLEVRTAGAAGALLAETTTMTGFRTGGISLTPTANNTVADDGAVELWIWLTLAGPGSTVAGRTVRVETVVSFTEGTTSGDTAPVRGSTFDIAVNNAPVVQDFTWTPAAPTWEQEVTFTPGTITDPDGDAIAYSKWDLGEGANPRVVERNGPPEAARTRYPDGGTFNVVLLVRDARGLEGSKTKQITVTPRPNQAPTVDFTWSPESPGAGQEVDFTSTVTDPDTPPDTPFTYAWSFGDGGTATTANPSHTYASAGTYTVRLEVTDRRGAKTTKEKTITVGAAPPPPPPPPPTVTGLVASPTNPEVGTEVAFTATATAPAGDPVTSWEWDFGDGSATATTTAAAARHTYTRSDVFTVRVRARNEQGGWSEWRTLSLYVRPKGGAVIGTKLLDNPARTQARIQIFLPQGASGVKIQIFDMLGRPVLSRDVVGTLFTWDLKDGGGRVLGDGLYFYLVTATVAGKTERSEVGKILVVR